MAKKEFVVKELDFLESQVKSLRDFLDSNKIDTLTDRIGTRMGKDGPVEYVVATIEAQSKNVRDSMKDYASLIGILNELRAAEDIKSGRGGAKVPAAYAKRMRG